MGRTTISGPKVKISIQPDTTKPVNLVVEYDKNATYTVGEELPGNLSIFLQKGEFNLDMPGC